MRGISNSIRLKIKDLLFPGMDFCLRKRLKLAKKYLKAGPIKTLEAGCGNAAFCLLCYKLGNTVIGIDINLDNIKRCIEYRDYKNIPDSKVNFMVSDIHDLLDFNETFDQILCFETLEHILDDRYVLGLFSKLLNPGGILHLGVPNLNCPFYYGEKISLTGDGMHVCKGYTYSVLKEMLESFGLKVIKEDKYGGIFTRKVTVCLRRLQDSPFFRNSFNSLKEVIRTLVFLFINPLTYLDGVLKTEPMSIYIMAKKS